MIPPITFGDRIFAAAVEASREAARLLERSAPVNEAAQCFRVAFVPPGIDGEANEIRVEVDAALTMADLPPVSPLAVVQHYRRSSSALFELTRGES